MKAALICFATIVLAGAAQAAPPREPPLPPPRPKFEEPPPAAAAVEACAFAMNGKVDAESLPPIDGANGCAVKDPVRVRALSFGKSRVTFAPEATLACGMAQHVTAWIAHELVPELGKAGVGLSQIQLGGSYECRGRNRVAGAKLSEHANGNALDLTGFKTADGQSYTIGKDKPAWFEIVKRTACARFETVLGPGSDEAHQDHLHLDMRGRKTPRLFCQWDVTGSGVIEIKEPADGRP